MQSDSVGQLSLDATVAAQWNEVRPRRTRWDVIAVRLGDRTGTYGELSVSGRICRRRTGGLRGSEVAKKKINAKAVLRDIKSGMRDNALMGKYDLSPGQLKRLMRKLEAAGLLEHAQPESPAPTVEAAPIDYSFFTCPACGFGQNEQFDDCPRCGVVVSKYEPPENPPEPKAPGTENKPVIEVWPEQTKRNLRGIKIIIVLALVLAVLVALVIFDKHRKAAQSTEQNYVQEAVSPENMDEESRLDNLTNAKPPRYRDMIDHRLPNVRPINPELDRHMKKSFGEIGDQLDDRTRAEKDLTNQP